MTEPMRISAQRPHQEQQVLFSDTHTIETKAACRVYVGQFFEEATRVLFDAIPHQINSMATYCPDLSIPRGGFSGPLYLEVKVVGQSNQCLIYQSRLEKDERFVEEGHDLFYCFWSHHGKATEAKTKEQLWKILAAGIDRCYLVPFRMIRRICRKLTPTNALYRIPLDQISEAAGMTTSMLRLPSVFGSCPTSIAVQSKRIEHILSLTPDERAMADEWHSDLSIQYHETILTPAPMPRFPGHCVRTVISQNPAWYRKLAASYRRKDRGPDEPRCRPMDTDLRRYVVVKSLENLANGRCRTPCDWFMRDAIRDCLKLRRYTP